MTSIKGGLKAPFLHNALVTHPFLCFSTFFTHVTSFLQEMDIFRSSICNASKRVRQRTNYSSTNDSDSDSSARGCSATYEDWMAGEVEMMSASSLGDDYAIHHRSTIPSIPHPLWGRIRSPTTTANAVAHDKEFSEPPSYVPLLVDEGFTLTSKDEQRW